MIQFYLSTVIIYFIIIMAALKIFKKGFSKNVSYLYEEIGEKIN